MSRRVLKKWSPVAAILAIVGFWILSERHYASRIAPDEVSTLSDHIDRFGPPRQVTIYTRGDVNYYHLHGVLPGRFSLALPSAPPVYVYDGSGVFVEWCSDPGDNPSFSERWPNRGMQELTLQEFYTRIGHWSGDNRAE